MRPEALGQYHSAIRRRGHVLVIIPDHISSLAASMRLGEANPMVRVISYGDMRLVQSE